MKKLISSFLLLFIISGCTSLYSCSSECPHRHLTCTVTPPTCETEGYTLNVCTECKAEFKTDYKLPYGHVLKETLFSPTCEKEGYTYYTCACGYSYRSDAIPPSGHVYTDNTVEPTCETAGYNEHVCSVCEYSYRTDYTDALGHDLTQSIIFPTKSEAGYTELTCSTCEKSYKDNFVLYSDIYGGGTVASTTVISKGIDISKWNNKSNADVYEPLDWKAIKSSGVDFAILRAGNTGTSTGIVNKDPVFEMNYRDAKEAGVTVGAYYYSAATTEEKLDEEINALLGWLDGKEFEYPIYIDMEDPKLEALGKDTLTKFCMRFVDRMRENGYFGAVYTNKDWLKNNLRGDALVEHCDVWFANYVSSSNEKTDGIYVWNEEAYGPVLSMWQYTADGVITDSNMPANATVDMNYCYKDYPSIIKKYGLNGYKLEETADTN